MSKQRRPRDAKTTPGEKPSLMQKRLELPLKPTTVFFFFFKKATNSRCSTQGSGEPIEGGAWLLRLQSLCLEESRLGADDLRPSLLPPRRREGVGCCLHLRLCLTPHGINKKKSETILDRRPRRDFSCSFIFKEGICSLQTTLVYLDSQGPLSAQSLEVAPSRPF